MEKIKYEKIYSGSFFLITYIIAVIAITSGFWLSYSMLILCLALLLIWDVGFILLNKKTFDGRSTEHLNESVTKARTYLSWLIPIYGAMLGYILTAVKVDFISKFHNAFISAEIPQWLVGLPIFLSIISLLFIPIRIEKNKETTLAMRMFFFLIIYLEKFILIIIAHMGIRIFSML